jgi:hypothetical protein
MFVWCIKLVFGNIYFLHHQFNVINGIKCIFFFKKIEEYSNGNVSFAQ